MGMATGGSASETSYIQLLDSNGNTIDAQTAYDAAMSGPIYVKELSSNASTYEQQRPSTIVKEGYSPLLLGIVVKDRGTMVSVIFICPILTGTYFYAGTNPSTLG